MCNGKTYSTFYEYLQDDKEKKSIQDIIRDIAWGGIQFDIIITTVEIVLLLCLYKFVMNNMIAGIFIKICFIYLLLCLFSIYNLLYVVFIRVLVRLKLYDLSKMKAKTDDKYFILHPEKFTYSSLG